MLFFGRSKMDDQNSTSAAPAAPAPSGPGAAVTDERSAANLRTLGLSVGASWDEITQAHARLVSDLTPGPGASHRNVALAEELLAEVNQALASLRMQSVA